MENTKIVGLLLPSYLLYVHEVVDGMVDYAAQHQHIHFCDLRFDHLDQARELLSTANVDALISGINRTEFTALKDNWPRRGPTINIHPAILRHDILTVCVNEASKSRVAFDYLSGLGYIHFASFGDSGEEAIDEWATELETLAHAQHFSHTLQKVAIPRANDADTTSTQPDPAVDAWIRELPKPAAIVTEGGLSATILKQSASRLGFNIPGEIAILSRNDDETCLFSNPPISAIRQRGPDIGRMALQILDTTLAGSRHPTGCTTIPSADVIERGSTGFPAGIPDDIKQAARYIRDYACDGIEVADVLKAVRSLSRTRLYEEFPKNFRHSPAAEIMRIRLDKAKAKLTQTNLTVGSIGDTCGFSSHSQFTDAFRREVGTTPLAWRKKHSRS